MYPFLQRLTFEPELKAAPPEVNLLRFDAAAIVRAIVFHLLDQEKVEAVNPKSISKAIHLLSQRMECVTISSDKWSEMQNAERLHWLQNQSQILFMPTESGTAWLTISEPAI